MKWKNIVFLFIAFLYMSIAPVAAAEVTEGSLEEVLTGMNEVQLSGDPMITIDAGLIEWTEEYLTATEGFILRYNEKTATGDNLYYDLKSGQYRLDVAGFTACLKEHPHYRILARKIEMVPDKYVAFSGVQVEIGGVKIPFLPRLVLPYVDGDYQFPDWLPELTYGEEGLGLLFKAEYRPTALLSTRATLELTTGGGVNLEGSGQYQMNKDFLLGSHIKYDDQWTGGVKLTWHNRWTGAIDADYTQGILTPHGSVTMIPRNVMGIHYKFSAGVTLVTENGSKVRHNKMYVQNLLKDNVSVGKVRFAWSMEPTFFWIDKQGLGVQNQLALSLESRLNHHWSGRLGYGRTDRWGRISNEFFDKPREEYVMAGLGFHIRDKLDEGWDVRATAEYSLFYQKLNYVNTQIIKAFDCFDVNLDVEWVRPKATFGVTLKY